MATNKNSHDDLGFVADQTHDDIGFVPDAPEKSMADQAYDKLAEFGQGALDNVVVPVGRFVDRYTGSPSRAALSAALDKKNPIPAFAGQFGQDPENAPTGKDIARRLGVVDTSLSEVIPSLYSESGEGLPLKKGGILDPTASGVAGLGVDLAADWTNLIPGAVALSETARGAGKAAAATAKGAGKLAAATTDLVTGTRAGEKTLKTASELTERAKTAIDTILNPKQAPNYGKAVEVAVKNGVDPSVLSSSVEFGKNSTITRLDRALREGPTGEKSFEAYNHGYNQISDAVGRKVETIGGGVAPNQIQAGEIVHRGLKNAQDELMNGADITFNKVQKYAPGLMVNKDDRAIFNSSLNGVEKYAKGLVKRGATDQQAAEGAALLRTVGRVRNGNGSFKQSVETLQMLGKAAFKDKPIIGRVSPDIQKLRDMYFDLNNALIETVRKDVSPEFAKELVQNNKSMTDFFKDRSRVIGAFDSDKAGEQVFKSFVLSGDSKSIGILKSRLKPEEVAQLKGTFLQSLIKPNEDGLINFNQFANALRGKKNQISVLFEPQEIQDLAELVKLGQDYGPAVLSTSGTGASSSYRKFGESILRGLGDEKALDVMKSKARSASVMDSGKALAPVKKTIPAITLDMGPSARGRFENILKGLQSGAPGSYDEKTKRRLRAISE